MATRRSNRLIGKLHRRQRRGTTAVEYAMVVPLFLLVVFALIEFSRFLWVQQALTNAAREGARRAVLATTLDAEEVDKVVRSYLRGTISNTADEQKVRVLVTPTALSTVTTGDSISTTVVVDYIDISLLPPSFVGDIAIAGSATVERE